MDDFDGKSHSRILAAGPRHISDSSIKRGAPSRFKVLLSRIEQTAYLCDRNHQFDELSLDRFEFATALLPYLLRKRLLFNSIIPCLPETYLEGEIYAVSSQFLHVAHPSRSALSG
jgi:hypothetical protein